MVVLEQMTSTSEAVTASTIIGGAGADSSISSAGVSNTSIVGGEGVNTFTPAASLLAAPSLLVTPTTPLPWLVLRTHL